MMAGFALDYIDVASRLVEFREKYPEGSLQPADPQQPFTVLTIGDRTFIAYTAAAYRTPDDQRPGIGCAYEPFPGKTNYTRDSELQNAETSAWGRAIVAALAADTKKGIASAEEVRNRREDEHAAPVKRAQRGPQPAVDEFSTSDPAWLADFTQRLAVASTAGALRGLEAEARTAWQTKQLVEADVASVRGLIEDRRKQLEAKEGAAA